MNAVNEMRNARMPAPVALNIYGGSALTEFLASVRMTWEQDKKYATKDREPGGIKIEIPGEEMYECIPLPYFYNQLKRTPLPPVEIGGGLSSVDANRIIRFLNATDKPNDLIFKRALNRLLWLSRKETYRPIFQGKEYDHALPFLTKSDI